MSDTSGTNDNARGNTNTRANKRRNNRKRSWILTINNPTEDDNRTLDELVDSDKTKDVIGQYESGENETVHIQVMINWKNPIVFDTVKELFPRAHIEPTRNLVDAALYCMKEETRIDNEALTWRKITSPAILKVTQNTETQAQEGVVKRQIAADVEDPLEGMELKWWQKEIVDLYHTKPNKRSIYWYWSREGGVGKSEMIEHLFYNYDDIIIITGSSRDAKYAVKAWCESVKWKRSPKMIIYDIARNQDSDRISYQAIEDMKNGVKACTKYESCNYMTARPHVIVFANQLPDYNKMSQDRWIVENIDDQELPWRTDSEVLEYE